MKPSGKPVVTPTPALVSALEALRLGAGALVAHRISQGRTGYPRDGGIALANALIRRNIAMHDEVPADFEPDAYELTFSVDGAILRVADAGVRAAVTCTVGPFDATPPVLRELALMPVTASSNRTADVADGSLYVSFHGTFDPHQVGDFLNWVRVVSMRYRRRLGVAEKAYYNGGAMPDLLEQFAQAGLAAPRIPDQIAPLMRRRTPEWSWASTTEGPDEVDEYLFSEALETYLQGAVPDHAAVSHHGHGLNSYGLTWRIAHGPIALCVQGPWGGAYNDPIDNASRLAGLFHRVSALLDAIPGALRRYSPEPRVRRLLIMHSDFRSGSTVQQWNGQALTWSDITPGNPNDIGEEKWWTAVEALVNKATLPL